VKRTETNYWKLVKWWNLSRSTMIKMNKCGEKNWNKLLENIYGNWWNGEICQDQPW